MWKTEISSIIDENVVIKGYNLVELMEQCSFSDLVMLMFTGEIPYENQSKVINAILVSCCDQGAYPPSTNATRFIASCGVPLQAAVSAGLLGIGEYHGGAIEQCAQMLQDALTGSKNATAQTATNIVKAAAKAKARIPGFGHAYVETDPRAVKLINMVRKHIDPCPHTDLLVSLEKILVKQKGKTLRANINGAVAAAISDLGVNWKYGRGLFIMSRSLGLITHAVEEMNLGTRYKKIKNTDVEYLGPDCREVPVRFEPS